MGAMRRFGSDRERRRRRANALYVFELMLREEGISDFVYDEKQDLFRFPDGKLSYGPRQRKLSSLFRFLGVGAIVEVPTLAVKYDGNLGTHFDRERRLSPRGEVQEQ
jgi:hypothetical protein